MSIVLAVALLLGTPATVRGKSFFRKSRAKVSAVQPAVPRPECTCSCCQVAERLPSEVEDPAVTLKCAVQSDEQWPGSSVSGLCAGVCQISTSNETPLASGDAEAMDQDRYCLYSCKPFQEQAGGVCVQLEHKESVATETDGGNGEDLSIPPEIPTVSTPAAPPPPPAGPTADEVPCIDRRNCIPGMQEDVRNDVKAVWKEAMGVSEEARAVAAKAPR